MSVHFAVDSYVRQIIYLNIVYHAVIVTITWRVRTQRELSTNWKIECELIVSTEIDNKLRIMGFIISFWETHNTTLSSKSMITWKDIDVPTAQCLSSLNSLLSERKVTYAISLKHSIETLVRKKKYPCKKRKERGEKAKYEQGEQSGKRWLLTDREGRSARIALCNRIASHAGGHAESDGEMREEGWSVSRGKREEKRRKRVNDGGGG